MKSNKLITIVYIILLIIAVYGGVLIGKKLYSCDEEEIFPTSPVEKIVFDTLYVKRDSIIYRTKYITKIQHDTIEKVINLPADSTLDLFYQLVSE